jgi:hypothetical protein
VLDTGVDQRLYQVRAWGIERKTGGRWNWARGMNSIQRCQWVNVGAQRAQDANHGNGDVKSSVYPTRDPGVRSHEDRRVGVVFAGADKPAHAKAARRQHRCASARSELGGRLRRWPRGSAVHRRTDDAKLRTLSVLHDVTGLLRTFVDGAANGGSEPTPDG